MNASPDGRPPFHVDHIGSLLRPPKLRQAFRAHGRKEMQDDEFARALDECVRDAVRMQEDVGLEVVTDGEFRRGSYWSHFVERTQGLEVRSALLKFRDDQGHELEFTAPYATGRMKRTDPISLDEFSFLKSATKVMPKITLPAPSTMHFLRFTDFAARDAYSELDAFFADLTAVFRQEIADLIGAGCRYVQIDEIAIPLLCDDDIRGMFRRGGADPDATVDRYIDALNACVKDCPPEIYVGVHMCRGNFKGHYLGQGGYDAVAERFFARTHANHFLLEYDTSRAGGFAPLRFVPKNKGVVLGLVSSKTPELESVDDLQRRIDDAATQMDIERLAISPQCGFASSVAGNPVSEADQWAKLRLLAETADKVWARSLV